MPGIYIYTALLAPSNLTLTIMTSSPLAKWDARSVYSLDSRAAAKAVFRYINAVPHDSSYYGKSLFAGMIACGTTHAAMTPFDVAKCNMQVRLIVEHNHGFTIFNAIIRSTRPSTKALAKP